jgi:hypothetical protein
MQPFIVLSVVRLSVIIFSVILQSVAMLSVIIQNVMAPDKIAFRGQDSLVAFKIRRKKTFKLNDIKV